MRFQLKRNSNNAQPIPDETIDPVENTTTLGLALDMDSLFGHLEMADFIENVDGDLELQMYEMNDNKKN